MLKTFRDIAQAENLGKSHTQRFFKNGATSGDTFWQDWSYTTGQPGYDARIGVSNTFTPAYGIGNDAIYFPDIPAGEERIVSEVTMRTTAGGVSQASVDFIMYDLIGYYPLIDGDSTDTQIMNNSLTLPRYESGDGLMAVLVNHISPMSAIANGNMTYLDSDGNTKNTALRIVNSGLGKVSSGAGISGSAGPLAVSLASGSKGIRQILDITFTNAPGGLFCLYIVKPLLTTRNDDGLLVAEKIATEKSFFPSYPRVKDGAHLGFFYRPNGGNRNLSIFGLVKFLWG